MEVRIKSTCNIKPSKPTWTGILPLSEWDQTGTITHTSTIHFYKPSEEWLMSSKSLIDTLKHSLGDVLVHFYTLSGRVRWIGQGRLELLCNAKGVELIEAESSGKLSDFGEFDSHILEYKDLVTCVDYEKPIDEITLMFVQLTTFGCGGVCLGISISHSVVDGLSAFHFITEWARLARGEPLEVAPCINTRLLRAHEASRMEYTLIDKFTELLIPPVLIGQDNTLEERKKATTVCTLPLSKDHVQSLKKAANEGFSCDGRRRPYSRFEVIAAHVWRSTCKGRKHLHEQETGMCFVVNVRDRLHPPLPPKYFGNAVQDVVVMAKAGELITKPLGYTCEKIRNAIERVDNDEYVWSNIEFFKRQPDLTPLQDLHARKGDDGEFYGNPNLGIISWLTLPIYGVDFGWGKEIYVGPVYSVSDGDCVIMPGFLNDGSVRVAVCLQMAHIEEYKKYFYEDVLSV